MTVYAGLLLFDIAEPAIGHWENQLDYRGYIEVWKHAITGDRLTIDVIEDEKPDPETDETTWEIYVDSETCTEYLPHYGNFSKVDVQAKQWMLEHPNGLE